LRYPVVDLNPAQDRDLISATGRGDDLLQRAV
jgi:hypothetical protein